MGESYYVSWLQLGVIKTPDMRTVRWHRKSGMIRLLVIHHAKIGIYYLYCMPLTWLDGNLPREVFQPNDCPHVHLLVLSGPRDRRIFLPSQITRVVCLAELVGPSSPSSRFSSFRRDPGGGILLLSYWYLEMPDARRTWHSSPGENNECGRWRTAGRCE